ncbi:MAG: maltose alpha-D-glucosyltransferase [Cyclobacteriaceae bacterium]|nr:maltose alpha-D-glucosyltransferase [Cyclobacteriaceae bacterium]
MSKKEIEKDLLWYKDAIIYELHIKAFHDKNGDGIGDFKGLLEKLDYLEDLGVTAIWLLPFYPSPLRDDGYDIADYFSINPSYGDIRDFKRFLKEAHRRNLKVITELVINHTSDQHPWFQRARRAKAGSNHRDFYVWSDTPDKYKDVRIIFQDFEASNWTWDPIAGAYYWHRFYSHQPDLNYDNPAVQKEIFRILDYWFDLGVDGFRLDAIPYLFQRENTNCENLPETHAFLKKLRAHVDKKYQGKVLLAEANMWPEEAAAYFGDGDECHMNYHFPIMPRLFMSVKMEDRYPVMDIFDQTPAIPENCQWAMFLRNHDELTLEMVTDEERDYMYKMFTKDPLARINLGIRHRLAPLLDNSRKKIELMNYLLFSLPGTPVIYYGDEIGMGDNYYLGDRDGVRTPMQWSADRNAGFSESNPQKLYLPVILDPEYAYESVNVENQQKNLSSLLWFMKRVIRMRKNYKAFGRGDIRFLSPSTPKVLAFLRSFQDETILVIANLSRFSQSAEIDLADFKDFTPIEVFSQNRFPKIKNEPYLFTMAPHGYFWFLLEKESTEGFTRDDIALHIFKASKWKEIGKAENVKQLESILPKYLKNRQWFAGRRRAMQRLSVIDLCIFPYNEESLAIVFVEVGFAEGLPEWYQLPLAFGDISHEKEMWSKHPQAMICKAQIDENTGILYDAAYNETFRRELFFMMQGRKKFKSLHGEISFQPNKKSEKIKSIRTEFNSRILSFDQNNIHIAYNDSYTFKIYRKLEEGINPDVEITRYLEEENRNANLGHYMGVLERHTSGRKTMIMGLLQEIEPHLGDALSYFRDSISDYFETIMAEYKDSMPAPLQGDFNNPMPFEAISEEMQHLIGFAKAEQINLLGQRTAELHLALASEDNPTDFGKEAFSLHYQRSLFASMQSQVRSACNSLQKQLENMPYVSNTLAQEILNRKEEILEKMKKIYASKINTVKIRNHSNYHLGNIMFTGRDFIIKDFEGEPTRSFSEVRLKRSPLRDLATMIRSFHYASFAPILKLGILEHTSEYENLLPWAEALFQSITGIFLHAYKDRIGKTDLMPASKEEFYLMMEIFLIERALYEITFEIDNRPELSIIPLRALYSLMKFEGAE